MKIAITALSWLAFSVNCFGFMHQNEKQLIAAIKSENALLVKSILTKGVDVNYCETKTLRCPLHLAAMASPVTSAEMTKILLAAGANPKVYAKKGAVEPYLLDKRFDKIFNPKTKESLRDVLESLHKGDTPLHFAATYGNLETCEILTRKLPAHILSGPYILGNSLKVRPVHLAASLGHTKVVKLLLDLDPDVDVATFHGDTAVDFAAMLGHLDTLKVLHSYGADLNAANALGRTPFMLASMLSGKSTLEWLLANDKSIDINLVEFYDDKMITSKLLKFILKLRAGGSVKQRSSLMLAALYGQKEVVSYLLTLPGINKNLRDSEGYRAIDIARRLGYREIVKLLY